MKKSFNKSTKARYSIFIALIFSFVLIFDANCQNITRVEYFVDIDPGFGMGIDVPVTPAANISNLQFPIDVGAMQAGFHTFYVRAKDGNGRWSLSQVNTFYKSGIIIMGVLPDITKAEYFIDTDPGFGLGNDIPVTPSSNISNLQFTIGLASVSAGFHTLYVRAKDGNGRWSLSQVKTFYQSGNIITGAVPDVTKAEYFIDTDPGFGLGNDIPVTPSANISNLQFTIGFGAVSAGFHTLYVRTRDGNGRWSLSQVKTFFKSVINPAALPDITRVEYFFDNDPGMGMGTNVPVTPSTNISNLSFIIDLSSLSAGVHTLWIRAKDSYGKWSQVVWSTFTQCGLPGPAGSISGPASVCVGAQGVIYSVSPIPNATSYQWSVPAGVTITGGTATNSITVAFSNAPFTGNISVRGTNDCGNGTLSPSRSIAANALLTGQLNLIKITIIQNDQVCWAAQSITTGGSVTDYFLVEAGGEATLTASQFVKLLPGTKVQQAGIMHAFITTQCIPCSLVKASVPDSELSFSGQPRDVTPALKDRSHVTVYPNPTSGLFTLEFAGDAVKGKVRVEIYNARGEKMLTEELTGESRHLFSLSDRSAGVYVIRVIAGSVVETIKVVRF